MAGRSASSAGRSSALGQQQPQAVLAGQAVGDVQVGREVAAFGDDHCAAAAHRRARCSMAAASTLYRLTEVESATSNSPGAGADEPRDLVADAARQIDPAGVVPAADQAAAPFVGDQPLHAGRRWPSAARRANCRRGRSCRAADRTARAAAPADRRRRAVGSRHGLSGITGVGSSGFGFAIAFGRSRRARAAPRAPATHRLRPACSGSAISS